MDKPTTNSSRPQVIDILVVAYRSDIFFLETQARSISLYIDSDRIANIYVCINDDDEYCAHVDVDWWSVNKDKVKIIPRSHLGIPDSTLTGWDSQQLYKLLLAKQSESAWSMCLDSKTWFVGLLDWDLWFDSNGRVNLSSFPTIPVFRPAQDFVEQYFNISSPLVVGPGGVPFMFHTETVKSMCTEIPDFLNFFCTNVKYPVHLTEFMLYSGYVYKKYKTHDVLYSQNQYYRVVNIADFEYKEIDNLIELMIHSNTLTASVHERTYKLMSESQFNKWLNFLKSKNILADGDMLIQKLNTLR